MPPHQDVQNPPHFALLPGAGMGHWAPFCRLAAALSTHGCKVSVLTAHSRFSPAESLHASHLLTSFPNVQFLHFPISQLDPSEFPSDTDPLYLRFVTIRRSAHLLPPLLSSASPPISALVVDTGLCSSFVPVANELGLPCYILCTTSASMLALFAYFPNYITTKTCNGVGDINIPGLWTVPRSSVYPPVLDPNHFFATQFIQSSRIFPKANGILINSFEAIEPKALAALNARKVTPDLPPVLTIGPLRPIRININQLHPSHSGWLDGQPPQSVVYVCLGSRTTMAPQQIKELGIGLEISQYRFLWVIKTKKLDGEEDEDEVNLEEVLGEGYVERVKERGLVVNGWVEQEEILRHRAIGGFVSHCGWNSVMEAALLGVRVLGWPRGSDQRLNGEVVRRSGLGVWMEEWSWDAEGEVVAAEEIAKRVKEMMEDEGLQQSAERVGEEARKAVELGGSSGRVLEEFIGKLQE